MQKTRAPSRPFNFATAVRLTIEELQDSGDMTTARLVEEVKHRYPDLIERHAAAFINEAVAKAARRHMKSTLDFIEGSDGQFSLKLNDITVPRSVSLPPVDGGTDIIWTKIEDATFRQLRAHIKLLQRSVDHDAAKLQHMQALEATLRPMMAEHHADKPIRNWLARLAAESA